MNYLDKLAKKNMFNRNKQKINHIKSFATLVILGVAIGGMALALFTKACCEELKNVDINNVEDNDLDISEDSEEEFHGGFAHDDDYINEEANINRHEIKETLEKAGEQSLGDVGVAIEHALEDNEDNI